MGGRSFGSPLTPSPPPHYMFLLATKLSFQPLTKLESDCLDQIGSRIQSLDQIGLTIHLKFIVTLKVIACRLLCDCEGLG